MREFGAYEAKTHFSELLNAVIHGEPCVITKHGIKVALLIPYDSDQDHDDAKKAISAIKSMRKGLSLGKNLSVKNLRAKGRK